MAKSTVKAPVVLVRVTVKVITWSPESPSARVTSLIETLALGTPPSVTVKPVL